MDIGSVDLLRRGRHLWVGGLCCMVMVMSKPVPQDDNVSELYSKERKECIEQGRKQAETEIAAAFEKLGYFTVAGWIKRGGYRE